MNVEAMKAAEAAVRDAVPNARPVCGLILGSGWGDVAELFEMLGAVPYGDIPGLGAPHVEGHAGRLVHAAAEGLETFVFQGRRHFYEGEGWEPVAVPIALLKAFGAGTVVVTNAAGGLRADLEPGDIMLIEDHINLMGGNPLIGPHDPILGPRFPDQTRVYDPGLRELAKQAGNDAGIPLHHGVYAAVTGPTYETPAEVRALRILGADAVGMSTVPEAILANGVGLRVCGLSCITNRAADLQSAGLSHAEVTETMQSVMPRLRRVVARFWAALARQGA